MKKISSIYDESSNELKVEIETSHTRQITISDDMNSIIIYDVTRTWRIVKKYSDRARRFSEISKAMINERKIVIQEYELREVTVDELQEYRKNKVPGFVLKKSGEKYFFTEIAPDLSFFTNSIIGKHQCSMGSNGGCCKHLSAASDKCGGCAKVRHKSERIERFPFIEMGYETFNTNLDSFVVLSCLNYEEELSINRSIIPRQKLREIKNSLYDLYLDN